MTDDEIEHAKAMTLREFLTEHGQGFDWQEANHPPEIDLDWRLDDIYEVMSQQEERDMPPTFAGFLEVLLLVLHRGPDALSRGSGH